VNDEKQEAANSKQQPVQSVERSFPSKNDYYYHLNNKERTVRREMQS
jgi:hypothetical protein